MLYRQNGSRLAIFDQTVIYILTSSDITSSLGIYYNTRITILIVIIFTIIMVSRSKYKVLKVLVSLFSFIGTNESSLL